MGRSYKSIIMSNILLVMILIPEVILLNALIAYSDNILLWFLIGLIGILIVSYLLYIDENKGAFSRIKFNIQSLKHRWLIRKNKR